MDVSALEQVDGDAEIETASTEVDLGGANVDGDLTLTGNGSDSVAANTAGGSTEVNVGQGTASLHVVLPDGSLAQSVGFTITRQGNGAAEQGTTASGDPAEIDPLAGYQFAFEVPTLNEDAQLAFTIDLEALDAQTRAALLAGVESGSATTAVKGDAPGGTYQAFDQCTSAQTPEADGCVAVTVLAADGSRREPVRSRRLCVRWSRGSLLDLLGRACGSDCAIADGDHGGCRHWNRHLGACGDQLRL